MDRLLDSLEELKKSLDNLSYIKEIEKNINDIKKNQELKKKIETYHQLPSEELKQQIYAYKEFRNYKKNENNINFLILEINSILKKIVDNRSCNHENN